MRPRIAHVSAALLVALAAFAAGRISIAGDEPTDKPAAPPPVKALRYRVKVYASALDMAHGGGEECDELWFPERRIVANVSTAQISLDLSCRAAMHAFVGDIRTKQYDAQTQESVTVPTEEVQVPAALAERIFELADLTEKQKLLSESAAKTAVESGLYRWKPAWGEKKPRAAPEEGDEPK